MREGSLMIDWVIVVILLGLIVLFLGIIGGIWG